MADEISDIVLDGTSFMLYGDHSLTASVANPAGLRTSGADLLREYSQWSERELERMDAGAGQLSPENNGYLHSTGDMIKGGFCLPPKVNEDSTFDSVMDNPPTACFCEHLGHTYMACGAKLYAIDRLNNGSITKLWIKLAEKPAGTGWEWPTWTNETPIDAASGLLKGNYFYTQLLSYGPYLIALMDEDVSSMTAAAAALPGTQQIPAAGEPNSKAFCGIMVIDPDTGADLPPIANWAATPSVLYHAGISGSMLYTQQPDPTDQTPDGVTRYNGNLSLAYGGTIFNGALYVWDGFRVAYTSATPDLLATIPPAEAGGPIWWQWWVIELPSAKYQIGSHHSPWGIALASGNDIYNAQPEREVITGMVALQGQTLNDFSKYLSTNTGLYAILSGDVIKSVMTWGSMAWWNGLGAIQHQGDAYFPVGYGMYRVTVSGQVVAVGMDEMPVKPRGVFVRHGFGLTSAPTSLISQVISPAKQDTLDWSVSLWTYRAQGWHPVTGASVPVETVSRYYPSGCYYRGQDNVLFEVLTVRPEVVVGVERPFIVRAMTFVTNIFPFQRPENLGEMTYAYAAKGVLVLPPFDAGTRVLKKDWHSIAIYGRNFRDRTKLTCKYHKNDGIAEVLENSNASAAWSSNQMTWQTFPVYAGHSTAPDHLIEFQFPCDGDNTTREPSLAISIRFEIERGTNTGDDQSSPVIQAIRLQYHAGIMDYFRWAVTLSLPFRCLVDICGVQYADYVQATWDDAVRAIICKETPIHMVDVDGREYDVRVETASRRTSGVFWDVPTNKKQQDIAWSLTLIQVCPDSLCEV